MHDKGLLTILIVFFSAVTVSFADPAPRTYTNADLKPVPQTEGVPVYSNADLPANPEVDLPPPIPTQPAPIAGDAGDLGPIMTISNYKDLDGNGRDYWQEVMLDWEIRKRENARAIIEESATLRVLVRLAVRLSSTDQYHPDLAQLSHEIQASKEKLDELKAVRAELKVEEDELIAGARRARALGSWLAIDARTLEELDEEYGLSSDMD